MESVFGVSMSSVFQLAVLYTFSFAILFHCLRFCYSLAVAGNNRAMWLLCHPSPRWAGEENKKKKAKTHRSG